MAGIRPKHTSSHWFNKNVALCSILSCIVTGVTIDRAGLLPRILDSPRILKTNVKVIPSLKHYRHRCGTLQLLAESPVFFHQNEQRKTNSQFRLNSATFKLQKKSTLANKCRQLIASNVHDAHLQFNKDKNNKEPKKENIKAAHTAKHCSLKLWSIHASSATWEQECNNYVLKAGSFKAIETFPCNKSLGGKKTLLKWKKNR